jgi:hypothetical protein
LQATAESQLVRTIRSVQRGVGWLRERAQGISDVRGIAITIRALVSAERNPQSSMIQRLSTELTKRQTLEGSWNDELWDTTWAAEALLAAGHSSDSPSIRRAVRFILATQDSSDGTWYEEPWETMLVLDLLCDVAPDRIFHEGRRGIDWLYSLQRDDGLIVGTRYTGMAVSLFSRLPPEFYDKTEPVIRRGVEFLSRSLDTRVIWTDAAWSNYYALKAPIDTGSTINDPIVSKAVEWFIQHQEETGRWMQVSEVHDTAMATMVLSRLLKVPLVDITPPKLGVISANRENGTVRVGFQGPGAGAIGASERMKLTESVRAELAQNQMKLLTMSGRMRGVETDQTSRERETSVDEELVEIGRYAYGCLLPARIQINVVQSPADHLRLDVDERLIDLPWELIHDDTQFFCLRYALARSLISDQPFRVPTRPPSSPRETNVLVVSNPNSDLPASEHEGDRITELLRNRGFRVHHHRRTEIGRKEFLLALPDHDIIHFAGHAHYDEQSPDESFMLFYDGKVQAFEIGRFLPRKAPLLVFLNACWSGEEARQANSYLPMMRSLSRNFIFSGVGAFLGYTVPVPDETATDLAVSFYRSLSQGQSIGESLRLARVRTRDPKKPWDLTWASAILYGDPTARVVDPSRVGSGEKSPSP